MNETSVFPRPDAGTPPWAEGMPLLLPGGAGARLAGHIARIKREQRAGALLEARVLLQHRGFLCECERTLAETAVARFLLGEK